MFEIINSSKALKQYEIRKARNGKFSTEIVPHYVENLAIFNNSVPDSESEIKYLFSENKKGEFRNVFEKIVYVADFKKGIYNKSAPKKERLMKQTVDKAYSNIDDEVFVQIKKVLDYLEVGMNKYRKKYSSKTHDSSHMFRDSHLLLLFRVVFDLMFYSPYDLSNCEFKIIEHTLKIHRESKEEDKKSNGNKEMSDYAKALRNADNESGRTHSYHFLKLSLEGVVDNIHNTELELVGRKKP